MKNNYNKTVYLICPICGNDQFIFDEENENKKYKCSDCENEFSEEEIVDENSEFTKIAIDKIANEVINDLGKDLNKSIRKLFK